MATVYHAILEPLYLNYLQCAPQSPLCLMECPLHALVSNHADPVLQTGGPRQSHDHLQLHMALMQPYT